MSASTSEPRPQCSAISPRTCSRTATVASSAPRTHPPYSTSLETRAGFLAAHAAATTFRCTNPKSGTTWEVKVDYDRGTADSFPAEITGSQIAWHDTLHGGYYFLDRASGALTFQNASSTGGYATHHTCQAD